MQTDDAGAPPPYSQTDGWRAPRQCIRRSNASVVLIPDWSLTGRVPHRGSDLEKIVAAVGTHDVTVEALVEAGERASTKEPLAKAEAAPKAKGGAYSVVEESAGEEVVCVYNSYEIKDGLRERGFR